MAASKDPPLVEAIRQAAPASVEYRLYHGDERVTVEAIEVRLGQLTKPSIPIAYRRVISAFLRRERERLIGPGPASPADADES